MNLSRPKSADVFVSIVTVSLNAVETIEDALNSVSRQRAPFLIEHVCIDGGSQDGTRDRISIAATKSGNITSLFEPDRGLFDAMNKGLRAARGRYVLILNADDFLAGDTSVADAFKKVDLASDEPDVVMGDVVMGIPDRFGFWRMRRVPRWLPRYPRLGIHPPHQGSFIKRELLLRANGFDAGLKLAADTTQFYRLVYEFDAKLVASGTTVAFMRMGGRSNKHLTSFIRGNFETYAYLRKFQSPMLAAASIGVKIGQKLFEYRLGRLRKAAFLDFDPTISAS